MVKYRLGGISGNVLAAVADITVAGFKSVLGMVQL
jgi:hypothetical protein